MADKNTLQMCESLLEELPREVTKPVRNPMWTFLKGIEDFDNARAADCLGLLLDAQYDSISVLKLATAQDLIENAGLRPVDALQIVSAAEDAVASMDRPDSGPTGVALPWGHESNQSFVNPQSYVRARFEETHQDNQGVQYIFYSQ